jgi:hypothetical protein
MCERFVSILPHIFEMKSWLRLKEMSDGAGQAISITALDLRPLQHIRATQPSSIEQLCMDHAELHRTRVDQHLVSAPKLLRECYTTKAQGLYSISNIAPRLANVYLSYKKLQRVYSRGSSRPLLPEMSRRSFRRFSSGGCTSRVQDVAHTPFYHDSCSGIPSCTASHLRVTKDSGGTWGRGTLRWLATSIGEHEGMVGLEYLVNTSALQRFTDCEATTTTITSMSERS